MDNIKYKKEELESMTVGNSTVNVIKVNGVAKWRKKVTITLRSDVDSFRFDNETYKEIETYYGYKMEYMKVNSMVTGSRYYFAIFDDNNNLVSRVRLSSKVSTINTFNLTDGETVTTDQTFYFIPIEQTLEFSNRTFNVLSIKVKVNDEPAETISGNETAVYDGTNVTITVESLYRLRYENQFDDVNYDENENLIYTKIINKISSGYTFDLTLASE